MNREIMITPKQRDYLRMILGADLKRMTDLADHAVAHQTEIFLPCMDSCVILLEKINGE